MAYSADTFVADEQPTTAKWNKLWSNDASFNDGTGIADDAIIQRHLSANIVGANEIAAGAVALASVTKTTDFSNATATVQAVTGMTISPTIPSGSRLIRISAFIPSSQNTTTQIHAVSIWDGTVGSGTQLTKADRAVGSATYHSIYVAAIVTPAAGAKTYNLGVTFGGGTGTLYGSATFPMMMLAEAL